MTQEEQNRVYGRESLVGAIQASTARVLLLTGDSGVGKSVVLTAAARTEPTAIAPDPHTIRHSEGALKEGLLRCLADVLATLESRGDVGARIERTMTNALDRVAKAGPKALGKVVVREVAEMVKARLGANVGDATRDFLQELHNDDPSTGARIAAARDPNLAHVICELFDEISKAIHGRGVVASLDRGELLDESDRRLLADIAEELPGPNQIRVAVSTSDSESLSSLHGLSGTLGVAVIEIKGLAQEAVELWMADEGLDPGTAERVWRVTRGYGLSVGDGLRMLKGHHDLDDLSLSEQIAKATDREWDRLDFPVRVVARKLAVLAEPLPVPELMQLVGVDEPTWLETVRALFRSRIFTGYVNGAPWFHELRRRHIEQSILTLDERRSAAVEALPLVFRQVNSYRDITRINELARLAEIAYGGTSLAPEIAAAVQMDEDELRLAGALAELSDPSTESKGAVFADELLTYARQLLPGSGDLASAYERLSAKTDLVVSASNERAAVLIPRWTGMALAVLLGRVARRFGRMPIPAFPSTFFELAILDRIKGFEVAAFGSGNPDFASMLGQIQRPRRRKDGAVVLRDYEVDPSLVAKFLVGGRNLYVAARYLDEDDRLRAAVTVKGMPEEFLDEVIAVREVNEQPVGRVPYLAFARAVKSIDGVEAATNVYSGTVVHEEARSFLGADYGPMKHQIIRTIRDLATDQERRAFGLDEPFSIMTIDLDEGRLECQVRGGKERTGEVPRDFVGFREDPFWTYKVSLGLGLEAGEYLVQMISASGTYAARDPVTVALEDVASWGREFNKTQPRLSIPYDPAVLEGLILDARIRERQIAEALVRTIIDRGRSAELKPPHRLEVALGQPLKYGPGSTHGPVLRWTDSLSPSGFEEVAVTWAVQAGGSDRSLELDGALRKGSGDVSVLIADWLGFSRDDLSLSGHIVFPWDEPALKKPSQPD